MSAGFTSLADRLLANFQDGTLASAVEKLAQDADDPVVCSCLYEAADKMRVGAALYEALEFAEEKLGLISATAWTGPAKRYGDIARMALANVQAALAKARGEA